VVRSERQVSAFAGNTPVTVPAAMAYSPARETAEDRQVKQWWRSTRGTRTNGG
jgi:hypothetical protein